MEKKDFGYFSSILTKWLHDLMQHDDNLFEGLLELGKAVADPMDRATHDMERHLIFGLRNRQTLTIRRIHRSLQDIEDGIYGICERCGEEISTQRLKARPVTRFCIHCKEESESEERANGFLKMAG